MNVHVGSESLPRRNKQASGLAVVSRTSLVSVVDVIAKYVVHKADPRRRLHLDADRNVVPE
jgi:hypothetical protein